MESNQKKRLKRVKGVLYDTGTKINHFFKLQWT